METIHKTLARQFTAGSLHCSKCGAARQLNRLQVSRYFAKGWPECCGETMRWDTTPREQN